MNGQTLLSEENMEGNQALSAKQKSIIPIAAFTANGDLEKLRTALLYSKPKSYNEVT